MGTVSEKCVMRLFPSRRLHSMGPGTEAPFRLEGLEIIHRRSKAQARVTSEIHMTSEGARTRNGRFTALQHEGWQGNIWPGTKIDNGGSLIDQKISKLS